MQTPPGTLPRPAIRRTTNVVEIRAQRRRGHRESTGQRDCRQHLNWTQSDRRTATPPKRRLDLFGYDEQLPELQGHGEQTADRSEH